MSIQSGRTEIPEGFINSRPAKFALAPVFTDHAVFQREKNFYVFGECPKGAKPGALLSAEENIAPVSITVSDDEETCIKYNLPKDAARFEIIFPAQKAGENRTLTVSCSMPDGTFEQICLTDICFGEVFLAGGQSNMEFELQNSLGGTEELEKYRESAGVPDIRYYYTPKLTIFNEERENAFKNTSWMRFDSDTAKSWSAIGYYFAKELSEKLGCTVGIIGCNWGGTSATAWTDTKRLWDDPEFRTYFDDYLKGAEGLSNEEQKAAYDEYTAYQAEWDRKAAVLYAEKPGTSWFDAVEICGENRYPGPKNAANPFRPGAMHESMLKPISPYTLRGFLYYQGESDDHKPQMYERLFTEMISNWREDWHDSEAWFLYVQLPMHRYTNDEDYKNWCAIREAQRRVNESENTVNTAMAAALDCGAYNDIHPKEKRVVAHRLAMQALEKIFGMKQNADAPEIISAEFENISEKCKYGADGRQILPDRIIRLRTKNCCGSLGKRLSVPYLDPRSGNALPVAGFEISEDGENYFAAEYVPDGDTAAVFYSGMNNPKYIRYAWTNYAAVELFGSNGLPLLPLAPTEISLQIRI